MVGVDSNEVAADEYGTFCIDDEDYNELRRSNEVEEELENYSGYESGDLNRDGNGSNGNSALNGITVSNESILGAISFDIKTKKAIYYFFITPLYPD